jgi:uncharacterized membrane protein
MQNDVQVEKEIHQLFDASLLLKGVHALIEVGGGLVFLFISKATIISFVNFFIQDEISEEPNNRILNYISQATVHFTGSSKSFAALYLISHGIINAFIVIALWKEKLWAYPVSFVVLGVFGIYQMYQYSFSHSLWLLGLTILDIVVLMLVWHEYGVIRKKSLV